VVDKISTQYVSDIIDKIEIGDGEDASKAQEAVLEKDTAKLTK
jgi:hypothetical protein